MDLMEIQDLMKMRNITNSIFRPKSKFINIMNPRIGDKEISQWLKIRIWWKRLWINDSWLGMRLFFNHYGSTVILGFWIRTDLFVQLLELFLLSFIFENLWWGKSVFWRRLWIRRWLINEVAAPAFMILFHNTLLGFMTYSWLIHADPQTLASIHSTVTKPKHSETNALLKLLVLLVLNYL